MKKKQLQKLKPLHNGIIFQFEDKVYKGSFHEMSKNGIILGGSFTESAKPKPRWAKVLFCGNQCKTIKPGMRVLIKNHQWTTEFKIPNQDDQYWKTDEDQILAIDSSV